MYRALIATSFFLLVTSAAGVAQTSTSEARIAAKDPVALALLQGSVEAMGGRAALDALRDVVASGAIAYYWGEESTSGTVTIKAKADGSTRFHADTAKGTIIRAANTRSGGRQDINGNFEPVGIHNSGRPSTHFFPLMAALAAAAHREWEISYLGIEETDGRRLHRVRFRRLQYESRRAFSDVSRSDLLIDSQSLVLVAVEDSVYGERSITISSPRARQFSDFRRVGPLVIPYQIDEFVNGEHVSQVRLETILVNQGVSDSEFTLDKQGEGR